MNLTELTDFFFYCSVINIGLFLWWVLFFIFGHEFMYRFHSRWFLLSSEEFDAIHYKTMALFKMFLIFFNIVPWLVLKLLQ